MSDKNYISKARLTAFKILKRCFFTSAWSSKLIDSEVGNESLTSKDTALVFNICFGVLRNYALCDYYINQYSKIKTGKMENDILLILRISVFQLVFLNKIPSYSVINDAVELCKYYKKNKACSFVNALLHKICECGVKEPPFSETAGYLSVRYSEPMWLCNTLLKDYGFFVAEKFFEACNTKPDITVQVNTRKISCIEFCDVLQQSGIEITDTDYKSFICLSDADISKLPGFNNGWFFVQDNSAAQLSSVCGELKGKKILDLCSAPGGKSFSCALKTDEDSSLLACDINPGRLSMVMSGAERLGFSFIKTMEMDASVFNPDFSDGFDCVIADVPCSGIGVIRRKPEIRLKESDDIKSLPDVQYSIISNAARYVKPGGTLVYSTCTVLKNENEAVISKFLENNGNFRTEEFNINSKESNNGCYTFWPQTDNSDGFFICKINRTN